MGSSAGKGEVASEHALEHRPFPITEIRTGGLESSATPAEQHTGLLRFLSYGLPWAAWLINVALLITPRYQKADVALCLGGDFLQDRLVDTTGNTNSTTLPPYLCEFGAYYLGVARCSEELMDSSSSLGVQDEVNDLASDDLFKNLALGASAVPVALGCILMCLCCGPVLLGEFAKGQSMLWNISFLVHFISAFFTGLTILFLETDICKEEQICTVLKENDRYSTVVSSILGFKGAIAALNDGNDDLLSVECQQTCSVDAGFYLSIGATLLWLLACGGTIMLKKANAKIHP